MFGKNNKKAVDVETIISKGTRMAGKLVSEGGVRIDGSFEGEINIEGDLVVGETGQVTATIKARNLLVVGLINGDVVANGQVEIATTGKVEGDVQTPRLIVEPGGLIQGYCKMPLPAEA